MKTCKVCRVYTCRSLDLKKGQKDVIESGRLLYEHVSKCVTYLGS